MSGHTCASVTDDDLLGLRVCVTAGVSDGQIRLHELCQEVDVADGEPQGVHLGQSFFIRQSGNVRTEPLERVIDGLHPPPLPDIGRLSQLLHLHLRPHPPPPLQQGSAMRGQVRGAVGAAVREAGGGGGEGQVAYVDVCSADAVFAVILLEMTSKEVDVVIQKVVWVQMSVS